MSIYYNIATRVSNLLAPINCLRFLAATLGASMLLFVGPFVMLWGMVVSLESVSPEAPLFIFIKVFSFIILLSSGYFLIGLYGHRVIHSLKLRVIAAILLSIPICFARIPFHGHHMEMPFFLIVMLLYVLLLSAFVWPVWFKRSVQPFDTGIPSDNSTSNRYRFAEN
jgi:hypothetical protein